jgi:catechol 2,3-dioxygenase-like lactoylglutathione lyase family enzyme
VSLELSAPDHVILVVEDQERRLDFYTQVLGLRLQHRSGEYAQKWRRRSASLSRSRLQTPLVLKCVLSSLCAP